MCLQGYALLSLCSDFIKKYSNKTTIYKNTTFDMMGNCVLFVKFRFTRPKTGVHFEICFISVPHCVGFERDLTADFLKLFCQQKMVLFSCSGEMWIQTFADFMYQSISFSGFPYCTTVCVLFTPLYFEHWCI